MAAMARSTDSVRVVSRTWSHSSHDLFDFEAVDTKVSSKTFEVSMSAHCFRDGDSVEVSQMTHAHDAEPPTGAEGLAMLLKRRGQFFVDRVRRQHGNGDDEQRSQRLWLVVRDLEAPADSSGSSGGHFLQEEDIFKLGRSRFRVRQIVTTSCQDATLRIDDYNQPPQAPANLDEGPSEHAQVCRICLMDEFEEDQLVTPCGCKGSIKHVHLSCLRYWVKGRLNPPRDEHGSFFYQPLACELCKCGYQLRTETAAGAEAIIQLPQPEPPFIVLESASRHFPKPERGLHILSLADGKLVKLGRSHDCHVRINDVSISRCQATIRYDDGRFILEDNRSKFGTLVALRKACCLQPGRTISIQAGRTVLSLCAQPSWMHPQMDPLGLQLAQSDDASSGIDGLSPFSRAACSMPKPASAQEEGLPATLSLSEALAIARCPSAGSGASA